MSYSTAKIRKHPTVQGKTLLKVISDNQTSNNQQWVECVHNIARKQDKASFKRLFDHFAPRLKSFYMKSMPDQPLAEELVQETFINVWKFAEQFVSTKANVSTWIYTIARNKRLDYLRKQNRTPQSDAAIDWEQQIISEDDTISNDRAGDELNAFIHLLEDEHIEILQKVYFEDLSHQKTAEALNITLGTVKGRVRSAVKSLRKLMGGHP